MVWLGLLLGMSLCALAGAPLLRAQIRRATIRARQAERRARDAERLAEIGAMTSGLAHEIKNPLSTIGLNAQLLAESVAELRIDADEQQRLLRRLGTLRRETERLRGILDDFLRYAGALHLHPRDCDLNRVVEELADFFLPQAERSGARMTTELAPGALTAWADPDYLKQALLNLMLNAVQVMQADKRAGAKRRLTLTTRAIPATEDSPARATIIVADTGPGVAPDKIERIFAPYFSTRPGGAGLGLPITRRIVEAQRGALRVESEPGAGARFIIELPVEQPADAPAEPVATTPA